MSFQYLFYLKLDRSEENTFWCSHIFIIFKVRQIHFFVILSHFLSFYSLSNNPENQQFDKLKIVSGDIIILQMYTINDNHVIGGSSDMEWDGHNFLSCSTIFCLFTPLANQKIKISKKWKKIQEISSFYTCVPKTKITWCMAPEIWCTMGRGRDRWTDGRKK